MPSAPAIGDIDGDGDDEIVVSLSGGSVFVLDPAGAFSTQVTRATGDLRGDQPSGPALGDVDGDGIMEIALWDSEYMYVLEANARTVLEWPMQIRPEAMGDAPPAMRLGGIESPLVADLDGNNVVDILFPLDDGTLIAAGADGRATASFPRVGPSGMGATPTLAMLSGGAWSLVSLGSNGFIGGIDAVQDSVTVENGTTLSIQALGGGVSQSWWVMARGDLARTGRTAAVGTPVASAGAFDAESFIIYPNPVKGDEVRARIDVGTAATVRLSIYTIEGQEAVDRTFNVNPGGLAGIPFDEAINVASLKSGIYLLRLSIDGAGGGGTVVKPFAIRR
jgi:hypothetical protein